jgi:hypothetical protein
MFGTAKIISIHGLDTRISSLADGGSAPCEQFYPNTIEVAGAHGIEGH